MAEEQGNGRGNGKDPVVAAIHELTGEVRTINTRLESVEQVLRGHGRQLGEVVERLNRVETGLADLRGEVHEGFAGLGQKFEVGRRSRPAPRRRLATARRACRSAGGPRPRIALSRGRRGRTPCPYSVCRYATRSALSEAENGGRPAPAAIRGMTSFRVAALPSWKYGGAK